MADYTRLGQQLGNYRLFQLLGEGGFAEVYLGEHVHLGNKAAIKVLTARLTKDQIEQFREEARRLVDLEHPNIVRVLDFGIEGNTPFLVMSYAPHGSLRERYPRGTRLPLDTIVTYAKQASAALQHAHNQRLVHRDVKPENILIGRNKEILLSDFGIASVAHSTRSQTMQEIAGTVPYMAPEQIQGKARPASDQYALAVIVYEWLSGSRPFDGTATEIAIQHLTIPPPPLREKTSGVSSAIEQVVMRSLAKDPHDRFPNVQDFANELERAAFSKQPSSIPTIIPPLPSTEFVARPLRATAPASYASRPHNFTVSVPSSTRDVSAPGTTLSLLLWTLVVTLITLWLIGLIAHLAGGFIHILLVIALVVLLYNLFVGSRARRL